MKRIDACPLLHAFQNSVEERQDSFCTDLYGKNVSITVNDQAGEAVGFGVNQPVCVRFLPDFGVAEKLFAEGQRFFNPPGKKGRIQRLILLMSI